MRLAFYDAKVASANGSFFDSMIRWRTASPYVHVELVDDSISPDTRASCFSAVPKQGVRWARIDITKPEWTVVPVPAFPHPSSSALVEQEIIRTLGQKYDWLGILGFGLPWGEHDDDDKFCSEACVYVLQAGGLFPHVDSWRVSPGDLYDMVSK